MLIYIPMHRSDNRKPTAALFRASCRFYSADTINMFLHPYLVVFTFAVQRNRMYLYSRILYVQLKPFWRSRRFIQFARLVFEIESYRWTCHLPRQSGSDDAATSLADTMPWERRCVVRSLILQRCIPVKGPGRRAEEFVSIDILLSATVELRRYISFLCLS